MKQADRIDLWYHAKNVLTTGTSEEREPRFIKTSQLERYRQHGCGNGKQNAAIFLEIIVRRLVGGQ